MRRALQVLNSMQRHELYTKYAIGGGLGTMVYSQPFYRVDIDVFIEVDRSATEPEAAIGRIRRYLKARGGAVDGNRATLQGWYLRFFIARSRLLREAVDLAHMEKIEGVKVRVITAEHLVAMYLSDGSVPAMVWVEKLLVQECVDRRALDEVLKRHGLASRLEELVNSEGFHNSANPPPMFKGKLAWRREEARMTIPEKMEVVKKLRRVALSFERMRAGNGVKTDARHDD